MTQTQEQLISTTKENSQTQLFKHTRYPSLDRTWAQPTFQEFLETSLLTKENKEDENHGRSTNTASDYLAIGMKPLYTTHGKRSLYLDHQKEDS